MAVARHSGNNALRLHYSAPQQGSKEELYIFHKILLCCLYKVKGCGWVFTHPLILMNYGGIIKGGPLCGVLCSIGSGLPLRANLPVQVAAYKEFATSVLQSILNDIAVNAAPPLCYSTRKRKMSWIVSGVIHYRKLAPSQ
ncbi:MAG: hypothetical protein EBZ77_05730 [Chitinophagia bacterium]|nr:hypothetical protein [Chitinophagia bacterium]